MTAERSSEILAPFPMKSGRMSAWKEGECADIFLGSCGILIPYG